MADSEVTSAVTGQEPGTFLVNEFGDHYLHGVSGSAFNQLGSTAVFHRHFGEDLWQPFALNLVVGSDSGLLIEYVLRHGVPDGSLFLFVEPEAVAGLVRARLGPLLADAGGVLLASPDEWETVADAHRIEDYLYKGRVRVLRAICATDGNLAAYTSLYWQLKDAVTVLNWRLIGSRGSAAFIRTQLTNLAENRTPAQQLASVFAGRTAVLFGGGPSFDTVLPWARAHRDELVVIAVSRVCRQLLQAEFVPDIVVSLDPHAVSFDVSKELLALDPSVLFVAAFHAAPRLVSQWGGRHAYLGDRYPWRTDANPANIPIAGPTVTNTALRLAVDMGCAQVILGGVDLCFSREGYTHASGSNEREAGPLLGPLGIRVETNDGGHANSRQDFVTSITMMGAQAEQARAAGCRVINPVATAARIPHVEFLPLDEIDFVALDRPAQETIADAMPTDDRTYRSAHYRHAIQELDRVDYRLDKVRELAREGLACNDGLFGRNGKRADFKYKKRMDKVERVLDKRYGDISATVKHFGDSRFLNLIRLGDADWTDAEIEQMGRDYYQTYCDSVDAVKQEIATTRQRLVARLDEEASEPDWDRMTTRWRDDGQPGRARLWRHRHTDCPLPESQYAEFDALDADFERELAARDTAQRRWCDNEYRLAPVRGKALFLYQHRDHEELARLAEGLAQHPDTEATNLHALVAGYASELAGADDEALAHYQRIVDEGIANDGTESGTESVLQDALARVAQIALARGDAAQATLALECLAGIAPAFQPLFAEVLRLTQRVEDAIAVYHEYLRRAPDDLATMLRLGRLYQELGSDESARMAFRYILDRNPDDVAAQKLMTDLSR